MRLQESFLYPKKCGQKIYGIKGTIKGRLNKMQHRTREMITGHGMDLINELKYPVCNC